jgi:hypothetical protein
MAVPYVEHNECNSGHNTYTWNGPHTDEEGQRDCAQNLTHNGSILWYFSSYKKQFNKCNGTNKIYRFVMMVY